jgi:transposase
VVAELKVGTLSKRAAARRLRVGFGTLDRLFAAQKRDLQSDLYDEFVQG